jgi:protein phosphatase
LGPQGDRQLYVARVASDEEDHARPHPHEPHLLLIEGATGTLAAIAAIERLQLRHPRLLAIRDFLSQNDRDYAVLDIPESTWPLTPQIPLSAEEALAVGVIIGEVIVFLQGHGVVHGHISTSTIVIAQNGVYLAGIEDALTPQDDAERLFQADTNQLAQTIGAFVVGQTVNPSLLTAVATIAAKGQAQGYERAEEVIADCLRALPDGLPQLSDDAANAPFVMVVGHATTVGMVRHQNQDSMGILTMEIIDDQPEASPGGVYVVADGMGGEAQGEVASRIATRIIVAEVARRFLGPAARATASDAPRDGDPNTDAATMMHLDSIASLTEAFRAANARIRNLARRLEQATGTTATALMLFGHEAIIGHVGDSRAYLCRGGELNQLTHDHSLVQKLIDMGQYHPNEAEAAMPRNYLYRSLGQIDDLQVDTRVVHIGIGDTFLICSDGLWDLVSFDEFRALLGSDLTPQAIAEECVRRANAAGGYDNSTALVLRCIPR